MGNERQTHIQTNRQEQINQEREREKKMKSRNLWHNQIKTKNERERKKNNEKSEYKIKMTAARKRDHKSVNLITEDSQQTSN